MLEKIPSDPTKINFYLVDNLSPDYYKCTPTHTWIRMALEKQLAEHLPQITINEAKLFRNNLPGSKEMGVCGSISFRAMIYCSFLYNPFSKIINRDSNTQQVNMRIFKLMYLQMARIRYSILRNELLWDPSNDFNLYYINKDLHITNTYQFHAIDTSHLWIMSSKFLEECKKRGKMGGFLRELKVKNYMDRSINKWVINLSLDADISIDPRMAMRHIRPSEERHNTCAVQAYFPQFNTM